MQADGPTPAGWSVSVFAALGVPVLQAICGGTARWQWEASQRGLNPLDTAMNVALPEFDGRIITVPISFKEAAEPVPAPARASTEPVHYAPVPDRVARVAGLALRFAALRRKPNRDKRVAFVLTNSPGKAAKIGNAVGLDAPASLLRVLAAMRDAGYARRRTARRRRRPDPRADRPLFLRRNLPDRRATGQRRRPRRRPTQYRRWFDDLPESQRRQMTEQWGPPPGEAYVHDGHIALAGLDFGNVFVALQPPRGYGMDPNAIYHQPDLPPPHNYYALYRWLRDVWRADAIVHLGKHGTLEWLPGKGVGLSADCFPDSFLGDLPLFYPFILNDPGEGAQAKRRGHAVIIDHLTPPMTTADAHGELAELMQLVDEYYQVELLDPSKMPLLQQQIWDLIRQAHLEDDLKYLMQKGEDGHTHEWDDAVTADGTPVTLAQMRGREVSHLIQELDGYLCELAGAQIRDGLHILGQVPEGEQMVGLLQALTRIPNLDVPSLRGAWPAFSASIWTRCWRSAAGRSTRAAGPCATGRPAAGHAAADALETIDELCRHLLDAVAAARASEAARNGSTPLIARDVRGTDVHCARQPLTRATACDAVLSFVCERLVPALRQTTDEIDQSPGRPGGPLRPGRPERGADARHGPRPADRPQFLRRRSARLAVGGRLAGGTGAGSRGPRALPTPRPAAIPETVGISVWGTSAMRTHGDDVAEVLALLGVRPVWQKENRRVVGVEVIPLADWAGRGST